MRRQVIYPCLSDLLVSGSGLPDLRGKNRGKTGHLRPSQCALNDQPRIIREEIREEKERQRTLYVSGTRGRVTIIILVLAVFTNIVYYIRSPLYPLILVSASFFLFMFYFITLLVPHTLKPAGTSPANIKKYITGLKETGFIRSATRFTRIFLNAFFINCRPLFIGFTALFTLDIAIVLYLYRTGFIPDIHMWIVLFQCFAIIVFYFLVWKLEPYSTEFFSDVSDMKIHLIRKKIPGAVVSSLFVIGTAIALISIISTIFLLPGVTVNNVLSISEFDELGHLIVAIASALVPLYFIFRYVHGITSRDLLIRFSENKTRELARQERLTKNAAGRDVSGETLSNATELLLEAQIYQVQKKTIFGTFPVYIVNPDFRRVFTRDDFTDKKEAQQFPDGHVPPS